MAESTYHSLDRDWLNKIIQNLSKSIGADFCPAHFGRILLHTFLPVFTHCLHCRNTTRSIAPIFFVLSGARGHLRQCLGCHFARSEIHIRADCGPKTVDQVHEKENEEGVEEELGVIGKNVGEIWVFFDKGEEGWDKAYFWDLNSRNLLLPRTRIITFPATGSGIRVRIVISSLLSKAHLFVGVPAAAFLDAPRYDVSVKLIPRYLTSP